MNNDHSRDRKILIIICIAIILLTAGGVVIGLSLANPNKPEPILTETEAETAARQAKNAKVNELTAQLRSQDITAEERADITKRLESLR